MALPPQRPLARVYAALFLVATALPALRAASGASGSAAARERRAKARVPALKWDGLRSFPQRFERWYADDFGYRDALLATHHRFLWKRLHTSPAEDTVKGRDDWIFYDGNETLAQVRGAKPFEEGRVAAWVAMLEERRAWLESLGTRYLFAIAPAKPSIYPDYLPAGYGRVGPARFDELADALEASPVDFVDLRQPLIDEREYDRGGDLAYYPLGTHWTRRGALRGWRELVAAAPDVFSVAPAPLDELQAVLKQDDQDDTWAERLYMEDELFQEVWVRALGRGPLREILPRRTTRYRARPVAGADLPDVILFHDSFGTALHPQLAYSCGSLLCFWRYGWDVATIEEMRPDLVIDLFVERTLVTIDPAGMDLPTRPRLRERFERAHAVAWSLGAAELARVKDASSIEGRCTLRFAPASATAGEVAWVRIEAEHADGGVLELVAQPPGTAPALAGAEGATLKTRIRIERAYVPPGRNDAYFEMETPAWDCEYVLDFAGDDWTLHAVEARTLSPATAH